MSLTDEQKEEVKDLINAENGRWIKTVIGVFATGLVAAGILYADVRTNTKSIDKAELVIEAVPVLEEQIQGLREDVQRVEQQAKDNYNTLRNEQHEMRQEILEEIRSLR